MNILFNSKNQQDRGWDDFIGLTSRIEVGKMFIDEFPSNGHFSESAHYFYTIGGLLARID